VIAKAIAATEDAAARRFAAAVDAEGIGGSACVLRGLEAERFDLTALVGAAGRADTMGALRRPTLRADVDARRLDLVLRAALVAPCLGRFSLRDGHERSP
jgi:hypothetical protein